MRGNLRTFVLLALLAVVGAPPLLAQREPPRREAPVRVPLRGWLGFGYRTPPEGRDGAAARIIVDTVLPDSPAQRAGLQRGDTVVRWNGETEVARALRESRVQPGDTVRLRVRRGGGRDRELTLVAARPRALALPRVPAGRERVVIVDGDTLRISMDSLMMRADSLHRRLRGMMRDSLGPRLRELERTLPRARVEGDSAFFRGFFDLGGRAVAGAEFAELNPGLAGYFGTDRGVLVLRVAPQTPAARAGLEAGDVVVRVGGEAVESIRALREAVGRERDGEVALQVVRKGQRRDLRLQWRR